MKRILLVNLRFNQVVPLYWRIAILSGLMLTGGSGKVFGALPVHSEYNSMYVTVDVTSVVPADATHEQVNYTLIWQGDIHNRPSAIVGPTLVLSSGVGSLTTGSYSMQIDPGVSGQYLSIQTWVLNTFGTFNEDEDINTDASIFLQRGAYWYPPTPTPTPTPIPTPTPTPSPTPTPTPVTTPTPTPTDSVPNDPGDLGIARWLWHAATDWVADPVDPVTGSFGSQHVDLHIEGPLPIEFARGYSSSNLSSNELGHGWLWNHNTYLEMAFDLSTIKVSSAGGSVVMLRRQGLMSDIWTALPADNPSVDARGGRQNVYNWKVTKSTVGTTVSYDLTKGDGSSSHYEMFSFPISGYTRTRPYLLKYTDQSGNYLTYTYEVSSVAAGYGKIKRIDSSNGTGATVGYTTGGLVSTITADDGRTVTYGYDASDDLTSVQLPDGATTIYEYEANPSATNQHLIVKQTEPGGRVLKNIWDHATGRVTSQQATVDSNATSALVTNATFNYSTPNQTVVTDAYSHSSTYTYNSDGLVTDITDALSRHTINHWYTTTDAATGKYQRSLQDSTDARGLVTSYKYDAQGNILEFKLTGDLDGDPSTPSEVATTSTTYNGLNLPLESTDPSGITTSYVYGDSNYPHLPTQIQRKKSGAAVRTDTHSYIPPGPSTPPFARGLLSSKIIASSSSDAVTCSYGYNSAGLMTQETIGGITTSYARNSRGEISSTTDAESGVTAFLYDGMSRPTSKTVSQSGVSLGSWTTHYTGTGEVDVEQGPRSSPGNAVTTVYDGAGRVKQKIATRSLSDGAGSGVVSATAATTIYEHDYFGNLVKVVDARGFATGMTYDAMGQLLSRSFYSGGSLSGSVLRTESFTREPGGEVEIYTNPKGGITHYYYTSTGKVRRKENPDGSVLQWRYYPDGRLKQEILRNGSYWDSTYDDSAVKTTRVLNAGSSGFTEVTEYDLRGNRKAFTDGQGYKTTFTYDALNRPTANIGAGGTSTSAQQSTTTSYTAANRVVTTSNAAAGESVVTTSDALGRKNSVETRNGGTVVRGTYYSYDSNHQYYDVTEGSGGSSVTTRFFTDLQDRPLSSRDAAGHSVISSYDENGNVTSVKDELGQITTYGYDPLNQKNLETLPDGAATSFIYDAGGNQTGRLMPGGLTAAAVFDSANRMISSSLSSSSQTTLSFTYDYYTSGAVGLLRQTTGPRATVTQSYDDALRILSVNTSGAVTSLNSATTYGYDHRNLVTGISQSSSAHAAGPDTQITRVYDGYGQITSEVVTVGGTAYSSIAQTWNASGRRSGLNESSSSRPAPLFGYQYRADGMMSQVTANSQNYTFAYRNDGRLSDRSNPFRTVSELRDNVGRVYQRTNTIGSQAMVEALVYRDNSTLTSYQVTRSGFGAWSETRPYGYNSRNQLTSEGFSPAPTQSAAFTYQFDGSTSKLGIRLDAKVGTGAPSSWQSSAISADSLGRVTQDSNNAAFRTVPANGYALGAGSVLLQLDGSPVTGVSFPGWNDSVGQWTASLSMGLGSHTLNASGVHPSGSYTATSSSTFTVAVPMEAITSAFDNDGNVTSRTWATGPVQTLTWDAQGRLIKVARRDSSINGYDWTAVYDGLGRRLQTTQQSILAGAVSGAAVVSSSIFDPQVEFLEIGLSIGGSKAWKVFGPDSNGAFGGMQGTGGLEATILDATGETKGLVADRFGNVNATIIGGSLNWIPTRVGGYGALPSSATELGTDVSRLAESLAWRTRRIDPTGFFNLGARHYEPNSGRFLSADPMGHASSMSLYDFANGDPVNSFDSDGRVATTAKVMGEDLWSVAKYDADLVDSVTLRPAAQGLDAIGSMIAYGSDHVMPGSGDGAKNVFTALAMVVGPGDLVEAGAALEKLSTVEFKAATAAAEKIAPVWPKTAEEMNAFLKVEGKAIPDTLKTPGRNKTVWDLGESKITLEQHPYDAPAPAFHTDPHWHLDTPNLDHARFLPGEPIPGY